MTVLKALDCLNVTHMVGSEDSCRMQNMKRVFTNMTNVHCHEKKWFLLRFEPKNVL